VREGSEPKRVSMPGVVGIISKKPRGESERELDLMIDSILHEPFYRTGKYVDGELGVFVGWACHQDSFADCNPVTNEGKDLVMIFSGENFTDRETTDQLKGRNHTFDDSNASYLVHLYEEKKDEFFEGLNGWFHGILIDYRRRRAILFNDRYGMQRVYYYEGKDGFYFSAEAKSLMKVHPELREIDMETLGEFFCFGCVLENRTLFKHIFVMPSGATWSFRNGLSLEKKFYFDPKGWEGQPFLEKESFYYRLKETIVRILPRYFRSRQQIGMSLTGGLDTRIIMACMDAAQGEIPCYTFGGMYRDSFDVKVAREVASVCHQPYQVIPVGREFLGNFPQYAERTIYMTDGCMDVTGSVELYVNRLAREIAPIRMTGDFGSEVLRGVRGLKAISPIESLFHPDFKRHVQNATGIFAGIDEGNKLSFTLFKECPWHEFGRLALEQSQLTLRTPFMDNDLAQLMYQAPAGGRADKEISLRLISESNRGLSKILTDRGVRPMFGYPLSILARLYYESLFKAEYFYNYGMHQWFAKVDHFLKPFHIERLFLGRHKFYHFRVWFRDELSEYVREILLDNRTVSRPYLNKLFLNEMINGHLKGVYNYTNEINKILTVELAYRLLIEKS
jgi:asparagine synthase (glutamine-hydrolysing)